MSSSDAALANEFEQKKDTGGSVPLVSFRFVAIQLAGQLANRLAGQLAGGNEARQLSELTDCLFQRTQRR